MGLVHLGIPKELVQQLAAEFRINNFIETGTNQGRTAIWASGLFKNVMTIEYSQQLYEQVKHQYKSIKNIEFIWGDSRQELSKLVAKFNQPALFWLDAHWSGGITYGENDECPLLSEIEIINRSPLDNFILIDDARLFTSPPPLPHKIEQWPNISQVIKLLESVEEQRYIVIIEDVIIAVPLKAKHVVASYCQRINSQPLESNTQALTIHSDIKKQAEYFFNTGEYEQAITLYEQSLEFEPDCLENYLYLGLALLCKGDESAAELSWCLGISQKNSEEEELKINKLLQILEEFHAQQLKLENLELANKIKERIAKIRT